MKGHRLRVLRYYKIKIKATDIAQDCGFHSRDKLKAIVVMATLISATALALLVVWCALVSSEPTPLRLYISGEVWTQDSKSTTGWHVDRAPCFSK